MRVRRRAAETVLPAMMAVVVVEAGLGWGEREIVGSGVGAAMVDVTAVFGR